MIVRKGGGAVEAVSPIEDLRAAKIGHPVGDFLLFRNRRYVFLPVVQAA